MKNWKIYLDNALQKTIELKADLAGVAPGSHEVKIEAYEDATLLDSDVKNVTVPESAISYQAETTAFMNATATPDDTSPSPYGTLTNHDCWVLCNDVVSFLKNNNAWSGIHSLHFMFGGTAAKHAYNLKDTNIFPMSFYGSWVHSANGNKGNGSNTYATFGFIASEQMVTENSAFVISSLSETTNSDVFMLGAAGNNIDDRIQISTDFRGDNYSRIGAGVITYPSTSGIGIIGTKRKDGTNYLYTDGVELGRVAASNNLPDIELYYGAYNYKGAQFIADNDLGSFAACTADVEQIVREALNMWETGLGRLAV